MVIKPTGAHNCNHNRNVRTRTTQPTFQFSTEIFVQTRIIKITQTNHKKNIAKKNVIDLLLERKSHPQANKIDFFMVS